ncbi:MAG: hypothetical protein GWN53_10990 [Gammaproteobacteria bacterium]|nr:hypothetical protein [Gammaproteobacteria bacterium]NIV75021.1 hypothetical protein [Gammaproteobacteria bacterium]
MRRRVPQRMPTCLLAWGLVAIPAADAQSPAERVFELSVEAGRVVGGG